MSYTYKGFELPDHRDPDWHLLIDPFFVKLIDNVTLNAYKSVELIEISNVVYVGKETSDGRWLIKKVVTNSTAEITWASVVNNPTESALASALGTAESLNYQADLAPIIT